MKEQQVEAWEEKLAQRAVSLAEAGRTLQQRRATLAPLLAQLQREGGSLATPMHQLMRGEAPVPGPQVQALREQAEEARRSAVEARLRAAQAWEEDLGRQSAQINGDIQGLVEVEEALHTRLQTLAEARARAAEPVKLVKAGGIPSTRTKPPLPPPTPEPRRAHPRAKLRVQVDFESDHNFFTGFSSDISEGGLFVATVNIQPIGAPVEVAFALPTGELVVAKGQVRWIREASDRDATVQAGMGIQFDNLSEDAREAVHNFIARREPIFYAE